MGSSRRYEAYGRASYLPWETLTDDGTSCRQPSPLPGSTGGPIIRQAVCPFECRVETPENITESPSELIIIEKDELIKFLASLTANAASPIKDVLKDLRAALQKLGFTGRAAIRTIKGVDYVVISGYPGLRKFLNAPKYKLTNLKVADLVIGTSRLANSAVKGTALSIVLVTASDVLEAVLDDKKLLELELGFTILTNVSKAVFSGLAGFIAGVTVAALGAPVVWPIAAGIVIGIVVGQALDKIFPTDKIVAAMVSYYEKLAESALERGSRWLQQREREILWRIWPHQTIPFPAW
jgi:hypothetical protein